MVSVRVHVHLLLHLHVHLHVSAYALAGARHDPMRGCLSSGDGDLDAFEYYDMMRKLDAEACINDVLNQRRIYARMCIYNRVDTGVFKRSAMEFGGLSCSNCSPSSCSCSSCSPSALLALLTYLTFFDAIESKSHAVGAGFLTVQTTFGHAM